MADMTYRPLGSSGLMVSTVGIGCNAFSRRVDLEGTRAIVRAALDNGVTLFDTADIYGIEPGASEAMLGEALGTDRENVILATKFGMDMRGANGPDWGVRGSRRYVRKAVESSLRRLRTDYIDLYQLHAPDEVTPIEETLAALHELVLEGKVRNIGSSNFAGWQVVDADWTARAGGYERFVSAQNKYSLLDRDVEDELVPACERVGVGILPFFPLEFGLLTGKYRRGQDAPEGTRLAQETEPARGGRVGPDRGGRGVRRPARPLHAAGGHGWPRGAAGRRLRHRRGHPRRAGRRQRPGRPVGADGRRTSRRWTRPRAWTDAGPRRDRGRPVSVRSAAGVIFAAAPRGCGAAGSAPRSQRGGQGFESPQLHRQVLIDHRQDGDVSSEGSTRDGPRPMRSRAVRHVRACWTAVPATGST